MKKFLLTTSVIFGLVPAGYVLAQEVAALQPASDWQLQTKGAGTENAYCALSRAYDRDIVLTLGRNKAAEYSLAIDFQKERLNPDQAYQITLQPSNGQIRAYELYPASARAMVVRLGYDESFFQGLAQSGLLKTELDGIKYNFDLAQWESGNEQLSECQATLQGGTQLAGGNEFRAEKVASVESGVEPNSTASAAPATASASSTASASTPTPTPASSAPTPAPSVDGNDNVPVITPQQGRVPRAPVTETAPVVSSPATPTAIAEAPAPAIPAAQKVASARQPQTQPETSPVAQSEPRVSRQASSEPATAPVAEPPAITMQKTASRTISPAPQTANPAPAESRNVETPSPARRALTSAPSSAQGNRYTPPRNSGRISRDPLSETPQLRTASSERAGRQAPSAPAPAANTSNEVMPAMPAASVEAQQIRPAEKISSERITPEPPPSISEIPESEIARLEAAAQRDPNRPFASFTPSDDRERIIVAPNNAAEDQAQQENQVPSDNEVALQASQEAPQETPVVVDEQALTAAQAAIAKAIADRQDRETETALAKLREEVAVMRIQNAKLAEEATQARRDIDNVTVQTSTEALTRIRRYEQKLQAAESDNRRLAREIETLKTEQRQIARSGNPVENNRYEESQLEIDRLSSLLEQQRRAHLEERRELENMLFDPAVAERAQREKLTELEKKLAAAEARLTNAPAQATRTPTAPAAPSGIASGVASALSAQSSSNVAPPSASESSTRAPVALASARPVSSPVRMRESAPVPRQPAPAQISVANQPAENNAASTRTETVSQTASASPSQSAPNGPIREGSSVYEPSSPSRQRATQRSSAPAAPAPVVSAPVTPTPATPVRVAQSAQAPATAPVSRLTEVSRPPVGRTAREERILSGRNFSTQQVPFARQTETTQRTATAVSPSVAPVERQSLEQTPRAPSPAVSSTPAQSARASVPESPTRTASRASSSVPSPVEAQPSPPQYTQEITRYLNSAGLSLQRSVSSVSKNDYRWRNGNIEGTARVEEKGSGRNLPSFRRTYLAQMQNECQGEFASVPSASNPNAYETACIGSGSDQASAVIFFEDEGRLHALSFEGDTASMADAMDMRDRLSDTL